MPGTSVDHVVGAHRITHSGGVFDRYFDQTVHGSTWQYVDNLWLDAGASLTVGALGRCGAGQVLERHAVRGAVWTTSRVTVK